MLQVHNLTGPNAKEEAKNRRNDVSFDDYFIRNFGCYYY